MQFILFTSKDEQKEAFKAFLNDFLTDNIEDVLIDINNTNLNA